MMTEIGGDPSGVTNNHHTWLRSRAIAQYRNTSLVAMLACALSSCGPPALESAGNRGSSFSRTLSTDSTEDLSLGPKWEPYSVHVDLNSVEHRGTWSEQVQSISRTEMDRLSDMAVQAIADDRQGRDRRFATLRDAPYFDMVWSQGIAALWDLARESSIKEFGPRWRLQSSYPVEVIMDFLMTEIRLGQQSEIMGDLPAEFQSALGDIDSITAGRVLAGRDGECSVNPTETFGAVTKLRLALKWASDCKLRRFVFSQLIREFPKLIFKLHQGLPELLIQKFAFLAGVDPSPDDINQFARIAIVPRSDSAASAPLELSSYFLGLASDLRLARRLLTSPQPKARFKGYSLFFAAVNRLVIVNGRVHGRFAFPGRRLPHDRLSSNEIFKSQPINGWAMVRDAESVTLRDWDWEQDIRGNQMILFPSQIKFNQRQAEPAASHQSLAVLNAATLAALAWIELVEGDSAELAQIWGIEDEPFALLDPRNPLFLPYDFKMIGYALLGMVFKNLTHADYGHIGEQGLSDPDSYGVQFFSRVGFDGRRSSALFTRDLGQLMLNLQRVLHLSKSNKKLAEFVGPHQSTINDMMVATSIYLGGEAQDTQGRFKRVLSGSVPNLVGPSILGSHVIAMQAMTGAYQTTRLPLLLIRLNLAWHQLGSLLSQKGSKASVGVLYEVLELWHGSQGIIQKGALGPQAHWLEWQRQIQKIENAFELK